MLKTIWQQEKKIILLFILLTAISLFVSLATRLFGDQRFFLYVVYDALTNQANIYDRIIDLNSPLIYYLQTPIIYFSRLLHIGIENGFKVLSILIVSSFAPYTLYLIRKIKILNRTHQNLIFWGSFTTLLFSGINLGQRDFFTILFLIPYILIFFTRLSDQKLSKWIYFSAGLIALIGISIKPTYLLIIVGIEVLKLVKNKFQLTLTLELTSFAVSSILYLFYLWSFEQTYIDYFFLGFRTYSGYVTDHSLWLRYESLAMVPVIAFVGYKLLHKKYRLLWVSILVISLAIWGAGLIQDKGFPQHFFPTRIVINIFIFYGIYQTFIFLRKTKSELIKLSLLALNLFFIAIVLTSIQTTLMINDPSDKFVNYLKLKSPNGSYGAISTELFPMGILDYPSENTYVMKFRNLWPLPGLYSSFEKSQDPFPYHVINEMNDDELLLFETTIQSLEKNKPEVVFIDIGMQKSGFGARTSFNFFKYFNQDQRFADVMRKYQKTDRLYNYDVYQLK